MKLLRSLLGVGLMAGTTFAQTVSNLYSFVGYPSDGQNPQAGLVQGSDGNFYGTTIIGGVNYYGTVFRINPAGSYSNLYNFGAASDGQRPTGLVQGSDGNFYGTTEHGGVNTFGPVTCGTVYRISPTGSYANLYSFGGPPDGHIPFGGLVQGSDGNFYGTTGEGGDAGTVFRISPTGSYSNLYSFSAAPDGNIPVAKLVQGSDGNFYGTTLLGGANYVGTVFRISATGSYSNLYSFGAAPDGNTPYAGLVQGSDGNFYGTTVVGGVTNFGTVYRISPTGSYSNLYSFVGSPSDGRNPYGGLVQG
ncbi:MAG: choice-of-anchor tandem repeat GloVer-containing protein, partial [Verrucomicrobiota bacterium]